jgi:hypothetical protein
MPIEYRIEHSQHLVQANASGTVSAQDFIDYQKEVWKNKDILGYDEIIDTTQVKEALDFTGTNIDKLAVLARAMDTTKEPTKLAIVAPADAFFGIGRMYEVYRELQKGSHKEVSVFRSMNDALAWIKGTK